MNDASMNDVDTSTLKGWTDELTFQLRLRGASGIEIGDAVAEVESYSADSGESPSQAFGDPREYALTLMPTSRREGVDTYLRSLVTGVCGYVAALLLMDAIPAWGHDVPIRWGSLVALGVMALMAGILTAFSTAILGSKKMWAVAVWGIVALVGVALPGVLLRGVWFTVPSSAALAIAIVLLLIGADVIRRLTNDPIRDPRTIDFDDDEASLVASGQETEALRAYRTRTHATLTQAVDALQSFKDHRAD